ncbi:MAG: TOBE domain-containing protein, partial [candidate division KSB1 bacterium]|nr:TOBE domain-containing protein [candidate division KSB1 bacterium]
LDSEIGTSLRLGFRPHEVLLAAEAGEEAPEARVVDVVYNGASEEAVLQVGEVRFRAVRPVRAGQVPLKLGNRVPFAIPPKAISLFDPQTGRRMDW